MKETTKALYRLHGWRHLIMFADGYLYLKYISIYVKVIERAFKLVGLIINKYNKILFIPVIKYVTQRYHGKVMTLGDAEKIINLDYDVTVPFELAKTVIPFERANQIILRNPDSIVAVECACRNAKGHDCQPAAKCLMIGEPYASFMLEHNKKANPRKLTRDEALELVRTCKEKGYVTNAYCKDGVGQQMYAICNCCPDCCVAISGHKLFQKIGVKHSPVAAGGNVAVVDLSKCRSNGTCGNMCPFGAISMVNNKPVISAALCMGCGICAVNCPSHAISLSPVAGKGVPLDIHDLVPSTRPAAGKNRSSASAGKSAGKKRKAVGSRK